MNHDEIKEKLIKLCTEVFSDTTIDADLIKYVDFADDLGMDSITFITLLVEIESVFAITVPDDSLTMDKFRNLGSIIHVVASQLTKK